MVINMNRIEERMQQLKENGKKAFVLYMTAGLPDMEGCKKLMFAMEGAGCDVLELGIPFSDPIADGPVIQEASYKSILQGTNLTKVFEMMKEVRNEGCEMPVVFMLYYNTVFHFGVEAFVEKCRETGVDGVIIPDLPLEEQEGIQDILEKKEDNPIQIQLVSPVSGERIAKIVEHARGFVYCVSSMGVTGQKAEFHENLISYLKEVKACSKIPVMMGFGIRTAKDVEKVEEYIDGCIVGSHFIQILEENNYSPEAAATYCRQFKQNF